MICTPTVKIRMKRKSELLKKSAKTLNSIRNHVKLSEGTMSEDLAAVDLVEDLHEDERIENHRVVEAILKSPKLIWSSELRSEYPGTAEEQDAEDKDLEKGLP